MVHNRFVARTRPPDRIEKIADSARRLFSQQGYRNTQVSDVAKLAQVATGTLYLYARSKEDLFHLALQHAMGHELGRREGLTSGGNLEAIRAEFSVERLLPKLAASASSPCRFGLEEIVGEFFDTVSRIGSAVWLVESCAKEWPELHAVFYSQVRTEVLQRLTVYLEQEIAAGRVRSMPSPAIAARLINETIAWFAMHRLGDADGHRLTIAEARTTTIDALTHAYKLPETQ